MVWLDLSFSTSPLRARTPTMSAQDQIKAVLDSVRPLIQEDGGDIEFVDYDEEVGIVRVRLMGNCESCPISMMTLKEGIQKRLQSTIPGVTEVTAI